ncbi:DUF1585 domain-containing protein [Aureliella helgolandensis]|uniref:DUF1585 domain-containing protein n=1 Tax=Aureliella helgolandensis TaxID=2527968 RepID=UPI0011A2C8E4|nr:DUF1585 domain-containing protein [Aureliella helgolandensis]
MGSTPPPPPADVEPLDPDTRGATSIREQLAKLRRVASCNDCHRKIDPPGFALENFDRIGGWRTQYSQTVPIDASGVLPGGKRFAGVEGLKRHLLQDKTQFYRALTTKLLEYATGRQLGIQDRPEVDRIVSRLENDHIGMRELLVEVATSPMFTLN